jgi:hypothetical protein
VRHGPRMVVTDARFAKVIEKARGHVGNGDRGGWPVTGSKVSVSFRFGGRMIGLDW